MKLAFALSSTPAVGCTRVTAARSCPMLWWPQWPKRPNTSSIFSNCRIRSAAPSLLSLTTRLPLSPAAPHRASCCAPAAAIAGTDAEKAARLPDSGGLRNQFIMRCCGRDTEADSVIRAAGDASFSLVRQIAAPRLKRFSPPSTNRLRPLSWWNSNRRAKPTPHLSLPVVASGEFQSSSTAACSVPPRKNLWHYTRDLGADAFITSGGKAIHGPQSTGLVLGKSWMIEACKFHASPNLRIGRGMKVGKEEFAGIYTAEMLPGRRRTDGSFP